MKITIWGFKNLALISGKILFTKPLKLHEKLFTQSFYVRKFLSPNPFLFGTNPSLNDERSLTCILRVKYYVKSYELHALYDLNLTSSMSYSRAPNEWGVRIMRELASARYDYYRGGLEHSEGVEVGKIGNPVVFIFTEFPIIAIFQRIN